MVVEHSCRRTFPAAALLPVAAFALHASSTCAESGKAKARKVPDGAQVDTASETNSSWSHKLVIFEEDELPERFMCISPGGIGIRRGPSVASERTGASLRYDDIVEVDEVLQGEGDQRFLRLKDGRGWVFTKSPKNTDLMCKPENAPTTRHPHAPPPAETLPASKEDVEKRLSDSKVLLFMKGDPKTPRCRHSTKIVSILRTHKVSFDHVDVLEEASFRVAMWERWPTYPQLWVEGLLLGGVDVVTRLAEEGRLLDAIRSSTARERLAMELAVLREFEVQKAKEDAVKNN